MGEGGGQILRSALSLSLAKGIPFTVKNIRAGRRKPGLLRQHLTAVNAAVAIGMAEVEGAELGSETLTFCPTTVQGGDYSFAVGTAGSATLVLQTVLPALMTADVPSRLELSGGTHNPFAPPFDFLERAFLPLMTRLGATVTAHLERPGFYPAGGGMFRVEVNPVATLSPIELGERGEVIGKRVFAYVSNLSRQIGKREIKRVKRRLSEENTEYCVVETSGSMGPGNLVAIDVESECLTEVFIGFGVRGVSSESVADQAIDATRRYLASGAPVGEYLADQLLVPFALAGGGMFLTSKPSRHTLTNLEVVNLFTEVKARMKDRGKHVEISLG